MALQRGQRRYDKTEERNLGMLRQLFILDKVRPNKQLTLQQWQLGYDKTERRNLCLLRQLFILGSVPPYR